MEQKQVEMPTMEKHEDIKQLPAPLPADGTGYMEQEYGGAAVVVSEIGIYAVAFGIILVLFGGFALAKAHKLKKLGK